MVRHPVQPLITDAQIAQLRQHLQQRGRTPWPAPTCPAAPGCWPTSMWCWRALMGNEVLAQMLTDLLSALVS